mgnify:CR=1 FL=1
MKLWRELEITTSELLKTGRTDVRSVHGKEFISYVVPYESQWPEPRDVRTDPPPLELKRVAVWHQTMEQWWTIDSSYFFNRSSPEFQIWLPLPPAPPQKSDAERAFEESNVLENKSGSEAHAIKFGFLAGFDAAKKGKL